MRTASLVTENGASVLVHGQLYQANADHPNFRAIVAAIQAQDYDAIPDLIDLRSAVMKWIAQAFNGLFRLVGDRLSYDSYTFGPVVTAKALAMIDAGNDAKPLLQFLAKVCDNPSHAAREELLLFCVANDFMIADNGNILAYKATRADYFDVHSGTVRYRIGDSPSMDRGEVDDDRRTACSTGLHFAAYKYAEGFKPSGGHLMIVEVNPADVVAIPEDYDNEKGRAWRVTVVAEVTEKLPSQEVYTSRAEQRRDAQGRFI